MVKGSFAKEHCSYDYWPVRYELKCVTGPLIPVQQHTADKCLHMETVMEVQYFTCFYFLQTFIAIFKAYGQNMLQMQPFSFSVDNSLDGQ